MRQLFEHVRQWGWNLYEVVIIMGGVAAAVFLSIRFSGQVNWKADVFLFLGILILYVPFDAIRLPYKDRVISLGFPIVLLALLGSQENGPLIAAEIATLGSLFSDSLYRLSVSRKFSTRFDRVLFYTAHHALATLDAMVAFDLIRKQQIFPQPPDIEALDSFADPSYLLAVAVYIVVYSLASSILIAPHDLAIRSLRLPEDEEQLPGVHPIGSVVLMAPVPIALSVFFFALTGTSRLVFSLVFPALFLVFLIIAWSYASIEREIVSYRIREEVRPRLLLLTRFDEELLDIVSALVDQLLRKSLVDQLLRKPVCRWIAIYSGSTSDGTLWLRGEMDMEGEVHIHPAGVRVQPGARSRPDATSDTQGGLGGVRWPWQAKPGQGLLGRAVETRLARSDLTTQAASQGAETDLLLPPDMAYLYIPLQHLGEVVALLALARPRRRFTKPDLDDLMPLTDVLSQSLISIQQFEKQIEELCSRVADYVADPTAVRRALENLVARGVTRVHDILALIPERAFQKYFSETLEAFAEGRAKSRFSSLNDEDLVAVYNKVRDQVVGGMPPLDDSILNELRTIASSLSVAFSSHHLSERDWSEAYTPLYRACRTALEAETIPAIIAQRGGIQEVLVELEVTEGIPLEITLALRRLGVAIAELEQSEQSDRPDVRREGLRNTLAELDAVERGVERLEKAPVRLIFFNWLACWKRVISAALSVVGVGEAELELALRSKQALPLERVDVMLQVRNVGRGVATRVVAELLPQVGYEVVGGPQFNLGALQTDKVKDAQFVIEPQETRRLRLMFRVSYRDIQDTQPRTLDFADQFFLVGELPTYRQVDNPYVVGLPLPTGSPLFYGRDDVFEFIRQNVTLGGRREPQVLVLVGERRVGKTSVARQLPLRLRDEGYVHVYFDAQSAVDPKQFLLTLATLITEGLEDVGITMDYPTLEEFQASPAYAFEHRFLPRVWKCLGDHRLLIAIDEYETLQRRVESRKEDPDIFEYLRSLIQRSQRMVFIFLGSQQMQEMTSDYWHVLFNIAKHQTIGLLSQAEARRLIVEPLRGEIVHDELAVTEILRGTGRHPYFLQMVCDKLVEICNANQVSYVTVQHVREALREVVKTGEAHLEWLWNSTSVQERVVLVGLAKCLRVGELGTAEAILHQAQRAGQALELDAAHWALGRLASRQVLRKPLEEADFYEFTADLYYTWIRLAHSLTQPMTDGVPVY